MPEKSSNHGGEGCTLCVTRELSQIPKSSHCVKLSTYYMSGMTLHTENTHPPSPKCLHKLHLFPITYREK